MAGQILGPLGTLAGAAIGTAVAGPAGTAIGAKLGSAAGGLTQGIFGAAGQRKADRMMPQEVDPAQARLLEEARRKARQAEAGTDAVTQTNIREAEQLGEATKSDLAKITGGNVGATIDAMLKAQRMTGKNINSALAQGSQRALGFGNMASTLVNEIAQRRADLQMIKASQQRAQAAQNLQTGMQNLQAGVISAIPAEGFDLGKFGIGKTPDAVGADIASSSIATEKPLLATPSINSVQEQYQVSPVAAPSSDATLGTTKLPMNPVNSIFGNPVFQNNQPTTGAAGY